MNHGQDAHTTFDTVWVGCTIFYHTGMGETRWCRGGHGVVLVVRSWRVGGYAFVLWRGFVCVFCRILFCVGLLWVV